jgi:hypothetical protein
MEQVEPLRHQFKDCFNGKCPRVSSQRSYEENVMALNNRKLVSASKCNSEAFACLRSDIRVASRRR